MHPVKTTNCYTCNIFFYTTSFFCFNKTKLDIIPYSKLNKSKGFIIKINIYQIVKKSNDHYEPIINDFVKMSSKYAKIEVHSLFNKNISKAQTIGEKESQKAYNELYIPKLANGYNIALDVLGKQLDSFKFSELINNKQTVNFFIGGAYGFDREFLSLCDTTISLSSLTFAHKIATTVLCEQVFRGLCIINNHPYHK